MATIILITGGGRSGKSTYAQARAEELPGARVFVATCPPLDDEMRERIEKQQLDRPLVERSVAAGEVPLHRLLVEPDGGPLLDHDCVLRAVAKARAEAVAVAVVDQFRLAIDDLDRAFRTGRDAETATVALLFDEPDHGALHGNLLLLRREDPTIREEPTP